MLCVAASLMILAGINQQLIDDVQMVYETLLGTPLHPPRRPDSG